MKTINVLTNADDVRDLAIAIVDELVEKGLVPDSLDTEDTTEFDFQDAISEAISKKLNISMEE